MPAHKSRKGNKRASRARAVTRRAVKPRRSSLLVIECDAEKLARDRITAGKEAYEAARALMPKERAAFVRVTSRQGLLQQFAECRQDHHTFKLIIVVGHSNATGIRLAASEGLSWKAFANWVSIFEPKKIVLLACEAGQRLPAEKLFDGLPALKEIYASPIRLRTDQARIIAYLSLSLLRKLDADLIMTAKAMLFVLTGAIIYQWRRDWYEERGEAEAIAWDLIQLLLNQGRLR